ncbi:MAG: putative ABC transporter ATP-binding protein YxlF [Phycisphaerae bacterium]|nr:putative ABC transporter ATP-binding protein YxlF [Phycisphaerae bacterium]
MMNGNWAVELQGLHKTYSRRIHALRGVDLRIGRGEIFGLLGPNGAGKSTLVKIMMTIVRPLAGQGTLLGHPLGHQPTLQHVGYLPENHRFPSYLTARRMLHYYGRLTRASSISCRRRAAELLDRLGMSRWTEIRLEKYSKGMLQRVGLCQALQHDPQLIVLDEPTDGVDPIGRKQIRELLLEARQQGKSILINSHILSELEMVCDRVAILLQGRVARQGTIAELTDHTRSYEISLIGDQPPPPELLQRYNAKYEPPAIHLSENDPVRVNQLLDDLRNRQLLISAVTPRRWSLEDVFIDAAQGTGGDQ